jgi:hypothetical protein
MKRIDVAAMKNATSDRVLRNPMSALKARADIGAMFVDAR